MPTYVAMLRAINVGGRYYKMAALRDDLSAAGLRDVETYIQTGNVRLTTGMRSVAKVEKLVEDVLRAGCGFEVPAIMFTTAEISEIHQDALGIKAPSFGEGERQRRYVSFFKKAPDVVAAKEIASWDEEGESALVIGRAVHIWLNRPTMEAKFFKAFKKVLAPGTNRDLKVVATLAERWGT
jgi:uncharacterized protein (DUF1697 family)